MDEPVANWTVAIDADTSSLKTELARSADLGRQFGTVLGRAFAGVALQGRGLGDVLRSLGQSLSQMALRSAFKPLEQVFSNIFSGIGSGVPQSSPFTLAAGTPVPFAKGGIISSPTTFPLGSGTGLAGERGAEAIMPLRARTRRPSRRGGDGRRRRLRHLQRHDTRRRQLPPLRVADRRHARAQRRRRPAQPLGSLMSFHEIRFPTAISLGAHGGPERRTDIVVLGSGHEQRNARWSASRRSYNAGYGVKTLDDLHAAIAFFEERRGRLYGFRFKDPADWRSSPPEQPPSMLDQVLGTGDGTRAAFQLVKRYGSVHAPYDRVISKPVAGTVQVAVAGIASVEGVDFDLDVTTGLVTFRAGHVPISGASVTAGFEFDVPVRFDTDKLEINVQGFRHGAIPSIPLVEIRI